MTKKLIINADGYGFTRGINRAIEDVCAVGFVRSVSVDANFPAVGELGEFIKRFPDVGVGVHFNLTVGRPVLPPGEIPSLVRPASAGELAGHFWGAEFVSRARRGLVDHHEMARELDAQVARILDLGADIDHWDSHQGMHVHWPFLHAAIEVARARNIGRMRTHDYWLPGNPRDTALFFARHPARIATFAVRRAVGAFCRFEGFSMADRSALMGLVPGTNPGDSDSWKRLVRTLPDGVTEAWCHPGYPDEELRRHAVLVESRQAEAEALADSSLVEATFDAGVELVRFGDLGRQ